MEKQLREVKMEPSKKLATVDDLNSLPEGQRAELINGAIVLQAAPKPEHSAIQATLAGVLYPLTYKKQKKNNGNDGSKSWIILTEVGVQYNDHNVFEHDLAGWQSSKLPSPPEKGYLQVPPDWVCEILSSNWRMDAHFKRQILEQAKVPFYWMINPREQSLTMLEYSESEKRYSVIDIVGKEDGVIKSPPFGIELDLEELFSWV